VDITRDVMQMVGEGTSVEDIRTTIVANYNKFGPPNQ
jgi:cytochrome c-type biogenesis protein CcmH/NrfF